MSNNYLTPKETSDLIIELSIKKASMSVSKRLLMSIMAGLFIALGAQGFIALYASNPDNVFIRSAVFPVGLMLIVLVGGELFTGNCLMTFGYLDKKISLKSYMSSLLQVFVGNLLGSLLMVLLVYVSGYYAEGTAFSTTILNIGYAKLNLSFAGAIARGILCNILVSLGVWFAYTAKDTVSKLFACWFPVMLFVLSGYEHVVANMFYMPLAFLLDNNISVISIIFNNFLPVALGNFIGGGILIPFIYYKIYYK